MLKKILVALFFIVLASVPLAVKAEEIKNYAVTARIQDNGYVQISEKIEYDFGDEQKHGIFRYIPYKYKTEKGSFKLKFDDISVTDGQGGGLTFDISRKGVDIIIKVGDEDKTITGVHTYVINYTVKNALNFFEDGDEFYWNVTGNGWMVGRNNVSASVFLPGNPDVNQIKAACYAGFYGDDKPCTDQVVGSPTQFTEPYLAAGKDLTIAVSFPKGLLREPTAQERILGFIRDNFILLLPVIVFVFLLWQWRKKGKDERGQGVVVAQFEAPDNLTPLEIGAIVDERAHNKDLSAEIVHLAVLGYLKINRVETKGLLRTKHDYEFVQLKSAKDLASQHDKLLMSALFDNKGDDVKKTPVTVSSLADNHKAYEKIQKLVDALGKDVVDKGYFKANPNTVRGGYQLVGGLIIAAGIFLSQLFIYGRLVAFISFCLSGALIIIFAGFMPAKTKKGRIAAEHILGLKKYLQVAEKARLDFHNAPEKKPEQFEKLLPFAMALGVEEQWAKQFESIFLESPTWYSSSDAGAFNTLLFVHNFGALRAGVNSSFAKDRSAVGGATSSWTGRSASGGGRGSSGGGYSGGGYGGGGGGSW